MKTSLIFFLLVISAFLSIVTSQEKCVSICDSSYPLHTVDKASELQACTRGCRIQYISYLSKTKTNCYEDCTKGYGTKSNEQKACVMGCKEEKFIVDNNSKKVLEVEETNDITFQFHFLHPVFLARKYYYTFFNNKQAISAPKNSNGFYFVEQTLSSDGKGNNLFVQFEMYPSGTQIVESHQSNEKKEKVGKEENVIHYYVNKLHGKATRWLNCVQVKAGIPYTTLVAILFLSLVMMAWICCSACDDDDEEDDDEEVVQKKHTFSKSGLSIMADDLQTKKFGDIKCFTITPLEGKNKEDEDDDELLQI